MRPGARGTARRRALRIFVAGLLVALAARACGDAPESHEDGSEPPADTIGPDANSGSGGLPDSLAGDKAAPAPADPDSAWTAGIVDRPPGSGGMATLVAVSAARHPTFDRVVWELSEMPGVHVEYVDEPVRACGSGHPVPLPGDGWLEIRLEPAVAHTEEGRPTVPTRRSDPALPVVLAVARTCDFEGIVAYALGVRSPEPYRLLALDDPPRVVVDVRHPDP